MRFAPIASLVSVLLWSALFVQVLLPIGSQALAEDFIPPMPEDFEQVDVYVLSVGRGPQIYAGFGHTILRVVDRARRLDMNFNWGIFDFLDPSFAWKFYIGDLRYSLAITDFQSLVNHYQRVEKRGVIQERVNLTAAQKRTLFRRLIWNSQPENIHYQYSQFYDNCATKIRDYLDEAVGGKLKERLTRGPSHLTFRDHIRSGANAVWWIDMGLDQLSNDLLDKPVLPWNEMFSPGMLRQHLRDLPAFDDAGLPIDNQMLLTETRQIVQLPEPPIGRNPYVAMLALLGIPMVGLLYGVRGARREKVAARLLGVVSVVFGFWSAFWGTAFVANWAVSRYPEVKHNANLLLVWPIDWVFFAFGVWLLFSGRRPARLNFIRWFAAAHVVGLVVLLGGQVSGLIKQDSFGMLASTGLLGLLYYITVFRHGVAREPT